MSAVSKSIKCGVKTCKFDILIDLQTLKVELKVRCCKCGKEWLATRLTSCCGKVKYLFTSVESGSTRPIKMIKSFRSR